MLISQLVEYYTAHAADYWSQVGTHIMLSLIVAVIAAAIGIPLGYLCTRYPKSAAFITGFVNVLRIVPSLAVMIIMIPLIGIGKVPAEIALLIIAIPPIVINTAAGFAMPDVSLFDIAKGMGMDDKQILWKVRVPLAVPLIFTGIRTSIVETIASATIAAYIGAGGLGNIVFAGIGMNRVGITALGGFSIAIISIIADYSLGAVQKVIERRCGVEPAE